MEFHRYIIWIKERYENRKTVWKLDDDDINNDFEKKNITTDHFCYCSQYYFLESINIFGFLFLNMGIMVMINQSYNVFADVATPIVIVF
jgi:hypothetical protein